METNFSSDSLDELCSDLVKTGKKLEILLRQLKRFENLENENESSLKMGLISNKDYNKSMNRLKKEKDEVENKIKKLLEVLIKEILRTT